MGKIVKIDGKILWLQNFADRVRSKAPIRAKCKIFIETFKLNMFVEDRKTIQVDQKQLLAYYWSDV